MLEASTITGTETRTRTEASDTRVRILEAGVACIARFGNEKTSIQDVADAARVSRGTIYRHFEDRQTLLAAISRYEAERMVKAVASRITDTTSFEQAVAILVEERVSGALRYRTRQHLRDGDRGFAEFLMFGQRRHMQAARGVIEPFVRRAMQTGQIGQGISVEEAIDWIAICLETVVPLQVAHSFDVDDPGATGRFYARFICRGLTG
jgi:AcrR family transcriptional regulator